MTEQTDHHGVKQDTGYAWYVVVILVIVYIVGFLDRQILSLFVDPIKTTLNVSDLQISLLQGFAFATFYSTCILPAGWLVDRFNRRNLLVVGVALWCLMTCGAGFAQNYTQLFITRMGVGIGEAILNPVAFAIIAEYFSRTRLPLAMSVFFLGGALGAGSAYILGAGAKELSAMLDLSMFGLSHLEPWQVAFVLVSSLGLVVVPLVMTIKEPPRIKAPAGSAPISGLWNFMRPRTPFFVLYCIGIGALTAVSYANMAWLPAFFDRVHGLDTSTTAVYLGLAMLTFGTAGTFLAGVAVAPVARKRIDAPLWVAMMSAIILGPLCLLGPLIPNMTISLLLYGPITFMSTAFVSLGPTAIQLIAPPHLRGRVAAIALMGVNLLGISLGPAAVPLVERTFLSEGSYFGYALSLASGGLALIAALLIGLALPLYRRAAVVEERQ